MSDNEETINIKDRPEYPKFEYKNNGIEITIQLPNDLLDAISMKLKQRTEELRKPHLLILWNGYLPLLKDLITIVATFGTMIDDKIPLKILGLTIEWTDVPDIIEVY